MNKKFLAVAIATLMIIGILPAAVQAQVVIPPLPGALPANPMDLTPPYPGNGYGPTCDLFAASKYGGMVSNDGVNDALSGLNTKNDPLGYMGPGGESGFPPFCVFLHPGAADTYKPGWSQTLDTLWGSQAKFKNGDAFPGTPASNGQTKLLFNTYLDYAVLASSSDSIGDFQFDILIPIEFLTELRIYVPPEFTFTAPTVQESIWTDITNDYSFISISTRNEYDTIAPHWTRITIGNEGYTGVQNFIINPGVYHIRLFGVRAPSDNLAPNTSSPTGPATVPGAGLYFFKIYYRLANPGTLDDDDMPTVTTSTLTSLGAGNYPIMIVKSELNPAFAAVTVRTHAVEGPGGFPGALVSGEVTAVGTTPEGRTVVANGFWGPASFLGNNPNPPGPAGALYLVWVFGLAAGTYQITAEASGFNPSTSDRFTVDAGQSYSLRIVVFSSAILSATVWSKHGTGAIPWHNLWQLPFGTNDPAAAPDDTGPRRDILFDLYSSDGMLLGFWGSDYFGVESGGDPFRGIPFNNVLPTSPQPTLTSYQALLVDNFDLLGTPRQLTSTNWEGHVPWDIADYVWGIPAGTYTLEVYVTGYVMDPADDYLRQVVVLPGFGIHVEQQIDLRRSNWIENVLHLQGTNLTGPTVTVTLTATDTGGNERAAASFYATPPMALDGVIDGNDAAFCPASADCAAGTPNWEAYNGGIVLEGWSLVFPNTDGFGVADFAHSLEGTVNDNMKDYGLNPTASTHSAGTVTLAGNPYTIKIYMADMGVPYKGERGTGWYTPVGGDPQVSVFLCNSPETLSFILQNASIWISLRSVDFEVPAHSRPWTFPGSEVWVKFSDTATGDVIDTLDPTIYGLIQDPGTAVPGIIAGIPLDTHAAIACPEPGPHVIGVDMQPYFQTGPLPNCHNGNFFEINGVNYHLPGTLDPGTNGLGQFVGWGVTPYDVDSGHAPGLHEHLGVWYTGTDWASPYGGPGGELDLIHPLVPAYRSTRLPAGEYNYEAFTHGYIMRRAFPFQIPGYGTGDIEADMIQGSQVRLLLEFFKEGVKVPFNGWIRAEVYDGNNNLVGASIYGQAQPNFFTASAETGGAPGTGGAYHSYEPQFDWQVRMGPSEGTDLGPPVSAFPSSAPIWPWTMGQRAWTSMWMYNVPNQTWASAIPFSDYQGWTQMYPSDANRLDVPQTGLASVDIYGFYWYWGGSARTWAGGWPTVDGALQPDSGLKGTVDVPGWPGSGGGTYTVKVWAFDPRGFDSADGVVYTPETAPDPGLIGKCINPTDAATIFDTLTHGGPIACHSYALADNYDQHNPSDDWQMYQMGVPLTGITLPWGGVQELYLPMNNMAKLEGTVRWYDMYGTLRPLAWARIQATDPAQTSPPEGYPAYSSGLGAVGAGATDAAGEYVMWLPAGTHDISVDTTEAPGIWAGAGSPADAPTFNSAYTVVVQDGWVGGGDTNLGESGTPIPEVPAFLVPLTLIAALAASVWLLRKQTTPTSILMK